MDRRSVGCSLIYAATMNILSKELSPGSAEHLPNGTVPYIQRANYEPPWANTSIIGIAGSSGSGKTSLSLAIIKELSLPWVVLMSMDSFYKPLTNEERAAAFRNEYDFDAPEAIDFDILVERLQDIKAGYCQFFFETSLQQYANRVRKQEGGHTSVLLRKPRAAGPHDNNLLASRLDLGGYIRATRSAGLRLA